RSLRSASFGGALPLRHCCRRGRAETRRSNRRCIRAATQARRRHGSPHPCPPARTRRPRRATARRTQCAAASSPGGPRSPARARNRPTPPSARPNGSSQARRRTERGRRSARRPADRTPGYRRGRTRPDYTFACVEEGLLAWFGVHGRDLPWRRTRDPYAILVSEVMAQQTQVDRVVPRWERWLERWPTIASLAEASPADVLREWQGLGYNRRALNLHRAAQHVAAHGWPDDLTELPGVGRYTADAVGCFAFGSDVLPVDVNVRRIQERTGAVFTSAAAQALMDLGATVCLARIPRCGVCPLATGCPSRGR